MKRLLIVLLLVAGNVNASFYLELGAGMGNTHIEIGRAFDCWSTRCHCQWSHQSDPRKGNFYNSKEDAPRDFAGCGIRWEFK